MRLGDGLRIFPSLWNVRTQCRWLCAGEEPLEKPSTVWHRSQLGARQNNPPMPVVMGYACAGSDLESALIMAKSRPHFHRSDEPCPLLTRSMTSSRSSIFGVARRKRRRFALRRLLAILHQSLMGWRNISAHSGWESSSRESVAKADSHQGYPYFWNYCTNRVDSSAMNVFFLLNAFWQLFLALCFWKGGIFFLSLYDSNIIIPFVLTLRCSSPFSAKRFSTFSSRDTSQSPPVPFHGCMS